jgi:MFS family permease
VHAPSLRSLQAYNLLTGLGIMLSAMTATAQWNLAGWSERGIGMAMTGVNIAYAVLVLGGGRLSDGWGRGRTAVAGAAISMLGCAVAAAAPGPWTALAAAVLAFAGSALFFPANVGLFSDAVGDRGQANLPLHQKVSRYNLGWACGNLGGFIGYSLLAHRPPAMGFALAFGLFSFVAASMVRWIRLPPRPPAAAGDRAPHPALARLTLMGRVALMVACMVTMAQISMLQVVLRGLGLAAEQAQRWAGITLVSYASCYVLMFAVLGFWSGWVLKPWRLWWLQAPFLLGAGGFLLLGIGGGAQPWSLALCGACLGLAFGPCYTASIFYSMRLPHGAGRAVALHETFLGVGNTAGPLLGGLFLDRWLAAGAGNGLTGLGAFAAIGVLVVLGFQAALIPAATRLGAR